MPILPFELLTAIFSHLPKKNLYECMKVCRSWYSAASTKFYKDLTWKNSRNKELLKLVRKPLIDGKRIGDYATKIEFLVASYSYADLRRHEVETVVDNLSNLEVILATPTYIDYLQYIPEYKLTRLQEISLADTDYYENMNTASIHFLANIRLKNQITTLKFSYWDAAINVGHEAVIRDLPRFTRLKNLVVFSYDDPWNVNHGHIMTFVLNTCPNLTYLEVHSDWAWNTAGSVRHTNLLSLELSIEQLDPKHIECIMRWAPNLKAFRFCADDYFYKQMSSMQDASEMLSYLKRIEYLEILTQTTTSAAIISIPFFWDFWINLCGNDCFCYLDATIARHGHGSHGTKFVKEKQHLKAFCLIGLDSTGDSYWVDQMNFLTFKSVKFNNEREGKKFIDYDGYLDLVGPVLRLLKQQQQMCAIDIEYGSQVVYFDSVPMESKELFDKARKRSVISHGYVREFMLENDLLYHLSTLYSFIQHLTLKNCLPAQNKNHDNTYHIDLTRFNKIQRLECDFDSVFAKREITVPTLYVQFIGVSGVSDYFYYDESKSPDLRYLGRLILSEVTVPFNVLSLKIHHAHINQFVFTRHGRVVPIIT